MQKYKVENALVVYFLINLHINSSKIDYETKLIHSK